MAFERVTPAVWRYRGERPAPDPASVENGCVFVLAPFAGGSAHSLAEWLPMVIRPGDSAYLLQYPGRGPRRDDPLADSLAELAAEAVTGLLGCTDGPFVLIGHSMGAILAYEIAARLEAEGQVPALLVASSSRPPGLVGLDTAVLSRLTTSDWVAQMTADGFTGIDAMPPDMMNAAVAVLRSDYLLTAGYMTTPDELLSCQVLALGGIADARVTAEHLNRWAEVTSGTTSVQRLPGGHFYYRGQLGSVARFINSALLR